MERQEDKATELIEDQWELAVGPTIGPHVGPHRDLSGPIGKAYGPHRGGPIGPKQNSALSGGPYRALSL